MIVTCGGGLVMAAYPLSRYARLNSTNVRTSWSTTWARVIGPPQGGQIGSGRGWGSDWGAWPVIHSFGSVIVTRSLDWTNVYFRDSWTVTNNRESHEVIR
jgi:hypothetical protein